MTAPDPSTRRDPSQTPEPSQTPQPSSTPTPAPAKPKRKPRHRRRPRVGGGLGLIVLSLALVLGGLAIVAAGGVMLRLPVWAVAEVEARLNRAVDPALPEGSVSVGGIAIGLQDGWQPVVRLSDLRLLQRGGASLLTLPETEIGLDLPALLSGQLRPSRLHVSGGDVTVKRGPDGRFDIALGQMQAGPEIRSLADLFAVLDGVFARPLLAKLTMVEADALSLTVSDARAGRTWNIGDGRLRLDNRADAVAVELAVSLAGSGASTAQADLVVVSAKGGGGARLTATVEGIAARDLAAQAGPLSPLALLDAPISGRLAATVGPEGISALNGRLTLGPGALLPRPGVLPIAFDRAVMEIGFDPDRARIDLSALTVESRTLRFKATGHAYMQDAAGQFLTGPVGAVLPASFLTQIAISEAAIDPEGLFESPVAFTSGALDVRLRLDPFTLDVGQLSLMDGPHGLHARGSISAGKDGWTVSLDTAVDRIRHDRLLQLWPLRLVPMTRDWLAKNVFDGTLTDVRAAVRVRPGKEPLLSLGYDFSDGEVRFINTLPPILDGTGYATVEGQTFTMVLDSGHVEAPTGGDIDMAGTVFSVLDFTRKPAQAEVQLKTRSDVTAALALLDQPPFGFLTKAGRQVDLGTGTATLDAVLRFPLKPHIYTNDVTYQMQGKIADFASDKIVPGKVVTVPDVTVFADSTGLRLTGPGTVGAVPFDVVFWQPFGKTAGLASVEGTVRLSADAARDFGVTLPDGMVQGVGSAQVTISLPKGQPATLSLVSDLNRIALAIPGTGWTKPAATLGRLEVNATLSASPRIDRLTLSGPGLEAEGAVTVVQGGGLERAEFTRVNIGDWFRGAVRLTGQGKGRAVAIAITGGEVDLRRLPEGGTGSTGAGSTGAGGDAARLPISVALDRVIVTDGISLNGLSGSLSTLGGLNGGFTGSVNGFVPVQLTLAPSRNGTAARVQSSDAGRVLAAAGIFASARGGTLDFTLSPRERRGNYTGRVAMRGLRVVDAPVLAELLNAVSVVGILDQLNGEGLSFSDVRGDLIITPGAIEVQNGAAVGASLGVTMDGVYASGDKRLALQGVISPVYLVNGIGSALTRRGEGVFGFNYELRGTADRPEVSVNPLSLLTPGLLRNLFRDPAPKLGDPGE
ncbi:MAG: hypothetical protein CFE34_10310 [Rhodobacteraceae bacterium PARR1]|nr:MAG: hypothetical protein CFE34_10310 [Rhodobacteraceae bacterium PARR1]